MIFKEKELKLITIYFLYIYAILYEKNFVSLVNDSVIMPILYSLIKKL